MSCNDEGVPFVETRVNSRLTDFLTVSRKLELLPELLPPKDLPSLGHRPISELTPLAFQVNVFACGGIVIGCYMLHKVLDTASLGTFFKYWAGLVKNQAQDANVVGPNFDAIVKAFPPRPTAEPVIAPDRVNGPPKNILPSFVVLARCFKITKNAITSLKATAASGAVPGPTSFEAVAGFVWENVMVAACMARDQSTPKDTVLSMSMNMRPRTNPPLPNESMGNCTTIVQAKAKMLETTLKELVGKIHDVILKAKPKIEKFQGENGIEEISLDIKETTRIIMHENSRVYHLSSWCKLGLNEADFGFGKPTWIIPTDANPPPSLRNSILFTDYSDSSGDDGIEVWLFLEEKEMHFLESCKGFLDYAFPNY
ncbi:vinorine synthase-like [Silene latifolia]|uniref:vinorine synthase-like n=1 Tax=Silene latifolia TaxID=37657 RepID=UPI003D76D70A